MNFNKLCVLLPLVLFAEQAFSSEHKSSNKEMAKGTLTVVGNWLDNRDADDIVLDHPGAISIIDEKSFQTHGATTIADALKGIPGVQIRDNNGTGGSDVSLNVGIRGLTTRLSPRATILMDGIPLSVAPYGQPQLSMAPLSIGNIASVDVIRGAGAVRYGPQNVGGIINFVSKPVPEGMTTGVAVQTQGTRYGSPKTLTSAWLGGTAENGFGASIMYSGLHGEGYRKNNNHVDIDDFILKTQYTISDTDQLLGKFHYYNGKGGMPGGLTEKAYAEDPFQSARPFDVFYGQRRDLSLKYRHQDDDKQFELLAYYTNSFRGSNIEQDGITVNPVREAQFRLRSFPRNYSVYAIEPTYSQRFLTRRVSNEITAGYRFLKEKSDEKAYRSKWYTGKSGLPLSDYYQHTFGGATAHTAYLDDTINFSNWTLIPGVRYEHVSIHAENEFNKNSRKKNYSEFLPSLSAMYHISDVWKLYANAGTSFSSIQYFQLMQGGAGNQSAPGLSAEKARTYEAGTRFDNTSWKADLTAFYIDFDNQLQLNGNEWSSFGATKHEGIEFSASYDLVSLTPVLEGMNIYTTYTYTKAYAVYGNNAGKDLPFYSRQIYTAGASYGVKNWLFNIDGYAQSKQYSPDKKYNLSPSADGRYGIIPGYMIWNLRGEYQFGAELANLKLGAGIKNLFDQHYYSRSTDNNFGKYPGEARTFYLQTSVEF